MTLSFFLALTAAPLTASIMGLRPHTKLLECLEEWYVGDYDSEEFFRLFNLEECDYIEFLYRKMSKIFQLEQMMEWNAVLNESKLQSSNYVTTLVSFKPTVSIVDDNDRRQKAHTKVCDMSKECFHDGNMNKIELFMKTFPMMAIFLSKKVKGNHNKKKLPASKQNKDSCKKKSSIFDLNPQQVHCLSAVNYFRHKQNTVVLWLATMVVKPFEDSINCMWHCNGLTTYLLCMLIKQHTSAGPTMDDSVLCLQATTEEQNVCRYYRCLGFSHIISIDGDNGLSQTSDKFQRLVGKNTEFWDNTSLHFFLLWCGKIILCKKATIDLTKMDIGSNSKTDKTLVEFPWPTSNMKKIESCIKSKPLLSHFSLSWLEETEHPYNYLIDKSMMQGAIDESVWQQ